jgi:hypothetical protein
LAAGFEVLTAVAMKSTKFWDTTLLRNVDKLLPEYTASHCKRQNSSQIEGILEQGAEENI